MAVLQLRCMFSRLRGFGGNLKGFDENDHAFLKKQVHVLLLKWQDKNYIETKRENPIQRKEEKSISYLEIKKFCTSSDKTVMKTFQHGYFEGAVG